MRVRKFLVEVCWIAPSRRTLPLPLGEKRGESTPMMISRVEDWRQAP